MNSMNSNPLDARLQLLSHSGRNLLYSCPRKYQLSKLALEYTREETIHTIYGKMFGEGVQQLLAGKSLEEAMLLAAAHWSADLWDAEKEKSFWYCFQAIELFNLVRQENELHNYELVYWNGKPAIELSFRLALPYGFYYRGYIDILLKHKVTGELLVVDAKTSNSNYSNGASYQNSEQVLSYSIMIDAAVPGASSYQVMYFEYLTRLNKFVPHVFTKDFVDRANMIRDLITDCEIMMMYNRYDSWPMHGKSCANFGRRCNFIDTCTMSTEALTKLSTNGIYMDAAKYESELAPKKVSYDIELTLDEVIDAQLLRG